MNYIDLRSDTVTVPTEEMRNSMAFAIVGDDVYEDDPTVKELECLAAKTLGKEAAIFVPSGTFGNQLSILTHTLRGDEVIVARNCHIVAHETGASAVIAGVQLSYYEDINGNISPEEIEKLIRPEDLHYPRTGLICFENAHMNGAVIPLENMKENYQLAQSYNVPVHLDGARIFNAAASLGVTPSEIAQYADSIMFCLSKGLCSPIGSMLVGSSEFIKKARKNRKIMGGAMRQVGILAAAGLISIEKMSKRLYLDHENAKYLAEKLESFENISVFKDRLDINMIFCKIDISKNKEEEIVSKLLDKGFKINPPENGEWRFVTHYWINKEHIIFS